MNYIKKTIIALCTVVSISLCACSKNDEIKESEIVDVDETKEDAPIIRQETFTISCGDVMVTERQENDDSKLISILTAVEEDWQVALAQWYFMEISSEKPFTDYKLVTIITSGKSSNVHLANNTPSFITEGEDLKIIDRESFIDEHAYDADDATQQLVLDELIDCMNQYFN